jgi:hypothetical protein
MKHLNCHQGVNEGVYSREDTQNIYKLRVYESIFVIMAISAVLDSYNVKMFGLGWSVDRILLGILLLTYPIYLQRRAKWNMGAFWIGMCGIMSLFVTVTVLPEMESYAIKYVPSMAQAYALFIVSGSIFNDNLRSLKIIVLITYSWSIILSFFSIYMIYYYYILGTSDMPFPLEGYYSYMDEHVLNMLKGKRLFMPFGSAPHLGAVTGCVSLLCICIYLQSRQIASLVISCAMLIICVLTLSRGPVLAYVLAAILLVGVGSIYKVVKVDRRLVAIGAIAILLFGSVEYYRYVQPNANLERLVNFENIQYSRHAELRLFALEQYTGGTLSELLVGHGFGIFQEKGIGAYSFSSYLTILVELGLLGSLVFLITLLLPLYYAWGKYRLGGITDTWYFFVLCLGIFIFLAHSFYELKTVRPLWILSGFVYGMSSSRRDVVYRGGCWL